MAAPRPLPTWIGPVGFALTYSICTRLPAPSSLEAYRSPASTMTDACAAAHAGAR